MPGAKGDAAQRNAFIQGFNQRPALGRNTTAPPMLQRSMSHNTGADQLAQEFAAMQRAGAQSQRFTQAFKDRFAWLRVVSKESHGEFLRVNAGLNESEWGFVAL
jgi:hypothetical protein